MTENILSFISLTAIWGVLYLCYTFSMKHYQENE